MKDINLSLSIQRQTGEKLKSLTILGHSDIKTTQMYTQISQANIKNIKSPLDNL